MEGLDVRAIKALDKETATSWLIGMIDIFIGGDPDLAASTCECCEDKRALLASLKRAGLMK